MFFVVPQKSSISHGFFGPYTTVDRIPAWQARLLHYKIVNALDLLTLGPHNFVHGCRILTKKVPTERPERDLSIGAGFIKIRPL